MNITSWQFLLFFILLLGPSNYSKAQTIRHFDVSYTPSFMRLTVPGDKLKNHRWGHLLIAELSLANSPLFSYKVGIGYSFQQAEYVNDVVSTGITIQTWFRYYDLFLPVHIKRAFSSSPSRFYATSGIIPSVNIGRKVLEYHSSFGNIGREVTQDQFFNRFELLVSLGVGYSYAWMDFGHLYLQPTFRTNYATQIYYALRYLFGRRSSTNDNPPGWTSIGLTFGYAW